MILLLLTLLGLSGCALTSNLEPYQFQQLEVPLSMKDSMIMTADLLKKLPITPQLNVTRKDFQLITSEFDNSILEDLNVPPEIKVNSRLLINFFPRGKRLTVIRIKKEMTAKPTFHTPPSELKSDGVLETAISNRIRYLVYQKKKKAG